MITSSQRPLPDNTRHSQQTNIHVPGGIRTHDLSRRAAADLRFRPRGYWDRLSKIISLGIYSTFLLPFLMEYTGVSSTVSKMSWNIQRVSYTVSKMSWNIQRVSSTVSKISLGIYSVSLLPFLK